MHSSHAVLFDTDVNLPASHRSHVDDPLVAEYVPGRHGVGSFEPVEQDEPAGQGVQSPASSLSVASEYVLAGHGSGAAAPSVQK